MKTKELFFKILISVVSLILTLGAADFILKKVNEYKFQSNYKPRLAAGSNVNTDRIYLFNRRFLMDIDKKIINEKTPLILFVGDSITLGVPLKKAEHSYPDIFDKNISFVMNGEGKYVARNISGPGGNIQGEAGVFDNAVRDHNLSPRLMILGYCLNDIFFSIEEERQGKGGLLLLRKRFLERRKYEDIDPTLYSYKQEKNLAMVKNAFAEIHKTAKQCASKTLVVIFPYFIDFKENKYRYEEQHSIVRKLAESEGLEVLDLYPFFREFEHAAFKTGDYVHPNPLGHKFAADIIYKYVSSSGLAPLPDMAEGKGLRVETDPEKAVEFCDSIYEGERDYGISTCRRIAGRLIEQGYMMTGKSGSGENFYFLNFNIPTREQ